ncbi:MAG TPA: glutamate--tRNA ligase family protein, partial [Smithellaceae bacterium]|nr:glutamate--tRNA ligase family protein [Smithellaceae bacterium]
MLYQAFGFMPPVFAHHSLILGRDRAKLSKRHGSVSVGEFRSQGILPAALMNYLGLLGSSFTEAREILNREEMIADFSLERASKSGAVFSEEKLRWLNAVYIRQSSADDLLEMLHPFLKEAGIDTSLLNVDKLNPIIDLVKNDITTLAEIGSNINIFFDEKYSMSSEAKHVLEKEGALNVVKTFAAYLQETNAADSDLYPAGIKYVKEKTGAGGRDLFMPIRAALTGKVHGPELDKIFALIGKDATLKRIKAIL